MKKLIFIGAFIINIIFSVVHALASPHPNVSDSHIIHNAGSVLVMDAQTGAVLYETEGFARRYPASVTKVMTALLVLEHVEDLNERIIFSHNAVDLPHYAGRIDMLEGESMTVLEALYGIMLPSANEVARALAEHVSGSVPEFISLMNLRADELGAYNTRFINPCGLPGSDQFITAYDIALIMQAAIQHPLFVEIISTPYFDLPPTELHDEVRQMRNSNVMVRPSREEYNSHVIGGKTGFTNAAQHTLVTYATHDDFGIIISVLFASPRGAIFSDTAALIDFIFHGISNVPPVVLIEEVEVIEEIETVEEPEEHDESEIVDEIEETEDFEESEAPEELETILTFTYVPHDYVSNDKPEISPDNSPTPAEQENYVTNEPQEISNTQALIVASILLAITASALLFLWLIYKQTSS